MNAAMKDIGIKNLRRLVQAIVLIALFAVIFLYDLYTKEIIDFRLLGIGDLNPYGGWSSLHELATDSSYVFEGISRSTALTIALILLSIMGGRFFCGWLCPLGTVQALYSWLGGKIGVPKYKGFMDKHFELFVLKYPILLGILLISIFGYGAELAGISPWRAMLSLPKAVYLWDEMKAGFVILAGILLASVFISRAFCRYLCPLGAAQSLFSSLSPLVLEKGKDCGRCNSCMKGCSVGIRLSEGSDTISPECIRCLECVDTCQRNNTKGIGFRMGNRKVTVTPYLLIMLALFMVIWLVLPQSWGGSTAAGGIVLGALKDGTYQGEAKGFAGKITTEVVVEAGRITGIEVISHQESKGWYEEVYTRLPKKIMEKQRLQEDGISGATKTSRGLVKSIENALKKAQ